MDLNDLYQRRGQSLMKAMQTSCEKSRAEHLATSRGYVDRIAELRREQAARA